MATHPQVSARDPRYALGSGDLPITRVVIFLLLVVPIVALFLYLNSADRPSVAAQQVAQFNPKTILQDQQARSFLPPPVAAIPAEQGAGPPVPAQQEQAPASTQEVVKVANTGGVGAILRAEPPRGRQVAALRDGQVLDVLERRQVGEDEWLRVKTKEGAEGWIYGRLVGPAG